MTNDPGVPISMHGLVVISCQVCLATHCSGREAIGNTVCVWEVGTADIGCASWESVAGHPYLEP